MSRAVLSGIPGGDPLTRFEVESARQHIIEGPPITATLTRTDLIALVSLVEGMRGAPQLSADNAPNQPMLFATGADDPVVETSRALSQVTSYGSFVEIPATATSMRRPRARFMQLAWSSSTNRPRRRSCWPRT